MHLRRLFPALCLLAAVVLAGACGGTEPQPEATPPCQDIDIDVPANLFVNPGFEKGEEPWFSMTTPAWGTPFGVSDAGACGGQRSALLGMRAGPAETGARVFGVVQEIAPDTLPEVISGYYRVEDWTRGTDKQYLQFVVIVMGATNLPGGFNNHQIRYLLAGIDEPPFAIGNAHFVFVNKDEPVTDRWVCFERNIRDDFEELWGAVPEDFTNIRILFEVRYDDKQAGSGEVKADVFYDDLYAGPAEANPSRAAGAAPCGEGEQGAAVPTTMPPTPSTPGVLPTVDAKAPLAEYYSPDRGYSVGYPEGWEEVEALSGPDFAVFSWTLDGRPMAQLTIMCNEGENQTLSSLMQQDSAVLRRVGGTRLSDPVPIEVAGAEGKLVTSAHRIGTIAIEQAKAYAVAGECGWRIGLDAYGEGSLQSFLPLFERIVASFRLD